MSRKLVGIQIPKPIKEQLEYIHSDWIHLDIELGNSLKEIAENIIKEDVDLLLLNADYINVYFKSYDASAELIAWLRFEFNFDKEIIIFSFLSQSQAFQISDNNLIYAAFGNSYLRLPLRGKINLNFNKSKQYCNINKNKVFIEPFLKNESYFNHQIKNFTAITNYNHLLSNILEVDIQYPKNIKDLLDNDISFKLLEKSKEKLSIDSFSRNNLKNKLNQLKLNPPTISVIDDQIDDGWGEIFHLMVGDKRNLNLISAIPNSFNSLKFKKGEKYFPPQVIFLDLKLAKDDLANSNDESSGFILLKLLKGHFPGVPVIIFSSSENANEYKKCMSLGASGFWNKYSSKSENEIILSLEQVIDVLLTIKKEEYLFNVFSSYMFKINIALKKQNHWWQYVEWTKEDITTIDKRTIIEQMNYFNQLFNYYMNKKIHKDATEHFLLNYRTMLFQHAGKVVELIHCLEGKDYEKVNLILRKRHDDLGRKIHNLRSAASHVHGWRELDDNKLIKLSYLLVDYISQGYSQKVNKKTREIHDNSKVNLQPREECTYENSEKPLLKLFIKKSLVDLALSIIKKL